jgi:hypothetical protein
MLWPKQVSSTQVRALSCFYFTPNTHISLFSVSYLFLLYLSTGIGDKTMFSLWGCIGWLGLRRPPFLWARGMVSVLRLRQLNEPELRQKLSADALITWEAARIPVPMLSNILYTEWYRRSITNLIPVVVVVRQQLLGAPRKADVLHSLPVYLAQTTPIGTLPHSNTSWALAATFPRTTDKGRSRMLFQLLNKNKTYYTLPLYRYFRYLLHSKMIIYLPQLL